MAEDLSNSVSINDLPTTGTVSISDRIRVYTLSTNNTYVPGVIKLSDLSNFIFTGEETQNLIDKFNSLSTTWQQFSTWITRNFMCRKPVGKGMPVLSDTVSTSAYFNRVYKSVYSLDNVKDEVMNEYATPQDLENLKASVYAYVENLALGYGAIRASILKQMNYVNLDSGSEE